MQASSLENAWGSQWAGPNDRKARSQASFNGPVQRLWWTSYSGRIALLQQVVLATDESWPRPQVGQHVWCQKSATRTGRDTCSTWITRTRIDKPRRICACCSRLIVQCSPQVRCKLWAQDFRKDRTNLLELVYQLPWAHQAEYRHLHRQLFPNHAEQRQLGVRLQVHDSVVPWSLGGQPRVHPWNFCQFRLWC